MTYPGIIDDFAHAAKRCEMGGFDGIERLSHANLLGQFLSPLTNQRATPISLIRSPVAMRIKSDPASALATG